MRRSNATTGRTPAAAIAPGTVIDGHRVRRVVSAHPGAETVVEARARDGRAVTLTILGEGHEDPKQRYEALRLIRVRASLTHPNLLAVSTARVASGRTFYATAAGGSTTLAGKLEAGPLEADEAVRILGQVAAALELAAGKGVVHRDLTPAAVRLDEDRQPRAMLGDFALARPAVPGCQAADAIGGAEYRSPEEIQGEPPRARSNVYSLACILAECLTGAPPYRHARPLLTMHAHMVEPVPQISRRRPGLPAAIDDVLARALAKDPRERFRSPAMLIEEAGTALGVGARVPVVADQRKQRTRDKVATREQRRRRRHLLRAPSRSATTRRRVGIPALAGLALFASAASGFATGNVDLAPEPRPATQARAGVADQRAAQAARAERTEYVRTVARTVDRLAGQRAKARRRLRQARHPLGQAAAATALASAYREARLALPEAPSRAWYAGARLEDGLRRAERAYAGLASAARDTSARAWRSARTEAVRSDKEIDEALSTVRSS